ncbi:HD domain-containing protein [Agrobacterium salinitolerans]|uniref:HD domain-containing protein n=1 Tax=Agrobacterium salinitolerans TaxID=1183413 RepID=A0A9X3KPH6_9HYPH|nr:HD domain-containing protein [Agrobacterium salinitolerans]MCZ7938008.1 HD domain-containing protein [Agrobacterium salinitolerans]
MVKPKPQRIRDPIHNLIEFSSDHFEQTLWKLIQTSPFQRLRRIKQLGFSEYVFPGATHTRFAHSLGVFHTSRLLMDVIRKYLGSHQQQYRDTQANHALTAALLHDVGHGMFSHAFEAIGKEFGWPMAKHEEVSQRLIREGEIADLLDREFGKGYAGNVADIIAQGIPDNLYGSVVSSQFDADRLDYMQRDRLMTGVQSSGIDLTWLLANLEVAEVPTGADETGTGSVETLVLGPKAAQAAESYVLGLFHLYPNVYLHKTTRGAEVLFQALVRRIVYLQMNGSARKTGLPTRHPILRFISNPTKLDNALLLDDTVFWGALPLLLDADDEEIRRLALALRDRHVNNCIDLRALVEAHLPAITEERREKRNARTKIICDAIIGELKKINAESPSKPARFMIDQYVRNPYKRFQDSRTPLNQILIRLTPNKVTDMGELSPVIAHAEPFNLSRVYTFRDDSGSLGVIENIVRTKIEESGKQ